MSKESGNKLCYLDIKMGTTIQQWLMTFKIIFNGTFKLINGYTEKDDSLTIYRIAQIIHGAVSTKIVYIINQVNQVQHTINNNFKHN